MPAIVYSPPEVALDETEGRHDYTLKGVPIPGLTGMLARAGLYDYSQIPAPVLDAASRFGLQVHEYTHWYDEDDFDFADLDSFPAYRNCLIGWQQFRGDSGFIPYSIEQPMAVSIHGMTYGMKPDRFGHIRDKLTVVEIKTTANIEPHFHVQTAAQAIAVQHVDPLPARIVVQLLKEPMRSGRCYRREEGHMMDHGAFLNVLAVEYWKRNHGVTAQCTI